jgi:hypothetical protein
MITYEQTEKVETGLDVAIKAEDGRVLAWAYSEDMAKVICDGLNYLWTKSDGTFRCSTCDTIQQNTESVARRSRLELQVEGLIEALDKYRGQINNEGEHTAADDLDSFG